MNPTKITFPRLRICAARAVRGEHACRWRPSPTEVIAESARARLTLADYEAEIAKLPPRHARNSRPAFAAEAISRQLYIARALAADARAEGLDKDPVLARQIATQVDKLLAQAQVERIEAATAARVRQVRRQVRDARARALRCEPRQVRRSRTGARRAHPGEGQGRKKRRRAGQGRRKSARRRSAGADFAQLAREFSDDPTAPRTAANSASSRRRRWTRRSRRPHSR